MIRSTPPAARTEATHASSMVASAEKVTITTASTRQSEHTDLVVPPHRIARRASSIARVAH